MFGYSHLAIHLRNIVRVLVEVFVLILLKTFVSPKLFYVVVSHYWDMCRYDELEVKLHGLEYSFFPSKNKIKYCFFSHSEIFGASAIRARMTTEQYWSMARRSIWMMAATVVRVSTMASSLVLHSFVHIISPALSLHLSLRLPSSLAALRCLVKHFLFCSFKF